ncbi:hypothetical protein EJ08DRAFT_277462 [Tothia fuscella]|uniref:Uncharacterized protein n=1 Tax=Tothia fuscella TaxID=1048955 RepID=A0A9P4NQ59_9PEZI|nr:hypothetical protein EJ08DRAFT_277462 [Tothia fuscella]
MAPVQQLLDIYLAPQEIRSRDTGPLPIPCDCNFSKYTSSGSIRALLMNQGFKVTKSQPREVVRMGYYRELDLDHTFRLRDRATAFHYKYFTFVESTGTVLSPYLKAWMEAVEEAQGPRKHVLFAAREHFFDVFITSEEDLPVLTIDDWKYCLIKVHEATLARNQIEDAMEQLEKEEASDGYWHSVKESESKLTRPTERENWADDLEGPEAGPGYPVENRSFYDIMLLKKWTAKLRGPWYTQPYGNVDELDFDAYGMPETLWEQLKAKEAASEASFDDLLIAQKHEWYLKEKIKEASRRMKRSLARQKLPSVDELNVSRYCIEAMALMAKQMGEGGIAQEGMAFAL